VQYATLQNTEYLTRCQSEYRATAVTVGRRDVELKAEHVVAWYASSGNN
jgi:hypothetical protein